MARREVAPELSEESISSPSSRSQEKRSRTVGSRVETRVVPPATSPEADQTGQATERVEHQTRTDPFGAIDEICRALFDYWRTLNDQARESLDVFLDEA